jgi:hypothetical protein
MSHYTSTLESQSWQLANERNKHPQILQPNCIRLITSADPGTLRASSLHRVRSCAREAPSNILTGVNGHGYQATIGVFHPHVTPSLPHDIKTRLRQSTYQIVGPQHRQPGHYTTTF